MSSEQPHGRRVNSHFVFRQQQNFRNVKMTGFDIDFEDKLQSLAEIEQEIKRQVAERLSNYELTMVRRLSS